MTALANASRGKPHPASHSDAFASAVSRQPPLSLVGTVEELEGAALRSWTVVAWTCAGPPPACHTNRVHVRV